MDKIFTDNLNKQEIKCLKLNEIFNLNDLENYLKLPSIYISDYVYSISEKLINKDVIFWRNNEQDKHWVLKTK